MKLTENFNLEEFKCPCCDFNIIDERLVNRLQVIRDIIKIPLTITSGCRCVKHNDEVGGKENSLHLLGLAVDWTIKDDPQMLRRVCLNLIDNWSGGFHYYPGKGLSEDYFCHCDIGKRRRWA
jgi:uncharacterized protein YcbK (DUF882 family)